MKRLLKVQQEIGTLSKNAKNPFFKSQYLDLSTILQHVTPLLNAEGLVLLQPLSYKTVGTLILDSKDGAVIAESYLDLPNLTDPQKLGSAITYFRRYTLKSLLAIAEDDDDGNKASKQTPTKQQLTTTIATQQAEKKTTLEKLKTMFVVTTEQEEKYLKLLK